MQRPLTCVEICDGAGGQALGLALAGFSRVALSIQCFSREKEKRLFLW